jgi:DNA-nicking Smr family endonuclease
MMSRRNIGVPDFELWDEVKKAVSPLGRRKAMKSKPRLIEVSKSALQTPRVEIYPSTFALPKNVPISQPPAISSFDRRTAQRLGRGSVEPESRIDLHGENLETARFALLNFIFRQRQYGNRLVLVITGKGSSPFARHTLHGHSHFHTPEREGKLRREVPMWFHDVEFRKHIIGFQPAHPRHGGGGAFYVKLRRIIGDLE